MREVSRRNVVAGLVGVSAAAALPGRVDARSFANGDMEVTVISDGHMMVGLDRLAAKSPDDAAFKGLLASEKIDGSQHRFAVNVTLIETGGKRILIDAGAGGTWVDTAGKLGDAMAAAGIDPKTIDHVALTHAHPDHLWGVVDDFDNTLRFSKATYSIPTAEFEFWMSPSGPETARAAEGVTAGARRILKMIEPKLTRVAAEREFAPGLAYIDAKGHTPGQCAVLASSGGANTLVSVDTIFHPVVSVQHPDWHPAQDMDGALAEKSRRKMLDIAASNRATVIAYHIADPGMGRVERKDGGYFWTKA